MGDLRAILREIILQTLKSANMQKTNESLTPDSLKTANQFIFLNNKLTVANLTQGKPLVISPTLNSEMSTLFKTILDNEEEFRIKIFSSGQELTTQSQSGSMLIDAKQLQEIGLKDMQTLHITLFSRVNNPNSKLTNSV